MDVMDFIEAINLSKKLNGDDPAVLLGNGFSIAYDRQIFSYAALFRAVDWGEGDRIRRLFDQIGTWDFELVIRKMDAAADVIEIYQDGGCLAADVRWDVDLLKNALINAISRTHPDNIFSVDQSRMRRTVKFLRRFSPVFTLNYDLLLYWALVTYGFDSQRFSDGFHDVDGALQWSDFKNQKLLYMHGALHLFQNQDRLEKVRYQKGGTVRTLLEQIVKRIAEGHAPLFVCEGTNERKRRHIDSSRYLSYCYHELQSLSSNLFIHGCSLGAADRHILDGIRASNVSHVFVSLHGDPDSEHNRAIIDAIVEVCKMRTRVSLQAHFYDSGSAGLW